MKQIALTQGQFAKVDDADYDFLNKYKWTLSRSYHGGTSYAKKNITLVNGKQKCVQMHRMILATKSGLEIDHIDGDGLNNQRSNLRICTHADNMKNRGINKDNTSGFKGVYWNKEKKKWRAYISCDKKWIYLGSFSKKEDAYKSYCDACIKYHGEFSKLK
jgi:hypothetical protein